IHTSIVIANKKNKDEEVIFLEPENIISDKNNLEKFFSSVIKKRALLSNDWIIAQNYEIDLIDKINEYEKLENLAIIEKGSTSGKNEVFTVSKEVATNRSFESKILRKNIKNGDITKYKIIDRGQVLIYIDSKTNPKDFPNIYNYLIENKEILKDRNEVRKNIYPWYRLERPRNKLVFDASEKIVVPYRAESNKFAYDNEQYFNDGGDIRALILKDTNINLKYVLGILNSKLMDWYYGFIGKPKGKSREYFNEPLGKIPIKTINFQIQSEKHSHDLIVSLVDQMLESKKQLHTAKTDKDKTYYERKCENLDKQIDAEVYKLYGLTEEEIKIVEGKE
ncbi:MAG: hypothetical protein NTU73_03305, partial [Ignavibacteriae bacterium]|nr:hypothetical protein [Ignavibacteriota bacterium]